MSEETLCEKCQVTRAFLIKERDSWKEKEATARAVVAAMREAVLEFEHRPPDYPRVFAAYSKDGEAFALSPDKVEGFFRALDERWKSADVKRWSEEFRKARSDKETWKADADRLAGALLKVADQYYDDPKDHLDTLGVGEALRLHDSLKGEKGEEFKK